MTDCNACTRMGALLKNSFLRGSPAPAGPGDAIRARSTASVGSAALLFLCFLSACSTLAPRPPEYTFSGPSASLSDTAVPDTRHKGLLFGAIEIDGIRIDNVFEATRRSGQADATPFRRVEAGFILLSSTVTRNIPARPITLKLRGSHATGAPIHGFLSALSGQFNSVEGEVSFTPVAGREYIVTGMLSSSHTAVWVEDTATGEPATAKVWKLPPEAQ